MVGLLCATPPLFFYLLAQIASVLIPASRNHALKPKVKKMGPKGKTADKGKGKRTAKPEEKEDKDSKSGKTKASQFINVRHILVPLPGRRE
jgi:hypothetical protein